MGAYASRLPLDKLDCRKAFRKGPEGEKLGDNNEGDKGVDHGDNIPLMGLSSDANDGDPSHNPDAWTPMNMTGIEVNEPKALAAAKEKPSTKKELKGSDKWKEKEERPPAAEDNFEVSFGKGLNFQYLDSDGFAMGGGDNTNNNKMANTEASDTTASDLEKETKQTAKTGKGDKPSKGSNKGSGGVKSGGKLKRPAKKDGGKSTEGGEDTTAPKPKKKKKPKVVPATDQ